MPIEIKELHVKVQVSDNKQKSTSETGNQQQMDDLLQNCLDEVFDVINQEKER